MEPIRRSDPLPYDRAFVIQLGRDADPDAGAVVGRAEHIATGRRLRFRSWDELLAFVVACAAGVEPDLPDAPVQRPGRPPD
jgi:hypothetical protein